MLLARVVVRFDSVKSYSRSLNDVLASLRKELLARRVSYFLSERKLLERVLLEGRSAGVFEFDDAEGTSDGFIWCTNSLLPYSLTVGELGRRKEIEVRVLRIADLLLNGICSRNEARKRPESIA